MTDLSRKTTSGLTSHFADLAKSANPSSSAARYRQAACLALGRGDDTTAAVFAQLATSVAIEHAATALAPAGEEDS
jgi:hypothetical protein